MAILVDRQTNRPTDRPTDRHDMSTASTHKTLFKHLSGGKFITTSTTTTIRATTTVTIEQLESLAKRP